LIRERALAYRDETAGCLSELVRIPSFCGKEANVIERLGGMLDEAGFEDVRVDGLGSLVGRLGRGGRTLAVDAHVDTVEEGDVGRWEGDPFSGRITGGFVWGRGSVDQKGGAASMVTAGRILRELGYDGAFTLAFTFTVMEEDCEGLCWNYLIEEEKLLPSFAVITEPTNLGVYRAHRGRMEIELFFAGVSSHGSAPERGVNAVYAAADAVREIRNLNGRLRADEFLGRGSVAVTRIASQSPSLCASSRARSEGERAFSAASASGKEAASPPSSSRNGW